MKVTIIIEGSEQAFIDGKYELSEAQLESCYIESIKSTLYEQIADVEHWLEIKAKLFPNQLPNE